MKTTVTFNWRESDDCPENDDGKWSDSVIVITNRGNVYYPLECMNGHWRRPRYFMAQECVALWTEYPEDEDK